MDAPVQVGQGITERPALPAALREPIRLTPPHVETAKLIRNPWAVIGVRVRAAGQATAQERRYGFDRHRLRAAIGQADPGPQGALAGQDLVEHFGPQAGDRVGQVNTQLAPG
jgi:hypothetical protein